MTFPTKLSPKQRQNIIETRGQPNARDLAAKYGVAIGTIYAVRKKHQRMSQPLTAPRKKKSTSKSALKRRYTDPVRLVELTADQQAQITKHAATARAIDQRNLLAALTPYLDGTTIEAGYAVVRIPVGALFGGQA